MNTQPKLLDKIPIVSPQQVAFGRKLGLNLEGCTVGTAEAMILDLIATRFAGIEDLGRPTDKPSQVAAQFLISLRQLDG